MCWRRKTQHLDVVCLDGNDSKTIAWWVVAARDLCEEMGPHQAKPNVAVLGEY